MAITTTSELKIAYPELVAQIVKETLGEDIETSVRVEKDAKGNIIEWAEETMDSKGSLVSRRVDTYSFYDSGEINNITQQVFDDKGPVSEQQVKHFVDGKKPVVTIINLESVKG